MGQDEQQANIRTMGSTRHMRKHSRMRELLLDLAQNHQVPKGPILAYSGSALGRWTQYLQNTQRDPPSRFRTQTPEPP